MTDKFQAAYLLGERQIIVVTDRTIVLLVMDANGVIQAETSLRPGYWPAPEVVNEPATVDKDSPKVDKAAAPAPEVKEQP